MANRPTPARTLSIACPLRLLLALLAGLFVAAPLRAQPAAPRKYAAEVRADLRYLHQTLEAAHYDLYAHTAKSVFHRELRRAEQSLPDSLTPLQINRLFQPFAALAGHGHCLTGYPFKSYNAFLAAGGRVFPFDVRVDQRRLFITANHLRDVVNKAVHASQT